jgi:hypothetical protein
MQTVDLTLPESSIRFQKMAPRPTPPKELKEQLDNWNRQRQDPSKWGPNGAPKVRIITDEGNQYTWNAAGDVSVKYANGATEVFWAKPKVCDAVHYRDSQPSFFQFHPDGAVSCRGYGATYFWPGKPVEQEITGRVVPGRYICDGEIDAWVFEDDPAWYDSCDCNDCRDCLGDYSTGYDDSDDCGCGNSYRCCGYEPEYGRSCD